MHLNALQRNGAHASYKWSQFLLPAGLGTNYTDISLCELVCMLTDLSRTIEGQDRPEGAAGPGADLEGRPEGGGVVAEGQAGN